MGSRKVRPLLLGLALLLLLVLPACPPTTGPSPGDLGGQVDRFLHDLRWKYNETASRKVDPTFSAAFLDKLEDMRKELNITAYAVRQVKMGEEKDEKTGEKIRTARLKVNLRYYLMPSTVVQDAKVKQFWREVNGRWLLISMEGGPLPFPPPEALEEDNQADAPSTDKPAPPADMQPEELGGEESDDEG